MANAALGHLAVVITAKASAVPSSATQVWRGGEVDREIRLMSPRPPYWLAVQEAASGEEKTQATLEHESLSWRLQQITPHHHVALPDAASIAITTTDITPALEEEFDAWYSTEHIPLLSGIPGVSTARRFRALQGRPRFVAMYHLSDPAVYRGERWLAANRTPWTLRMRPRFINPRSFMFDTRER